MHLLIVEDHRRLASSLRAAFEPKVTSVCVARTAKEALLALEQHAPDWLLLDLFLPDGSGFDVLEAANKNSNSSSKSNGTDDRSPMPHTVVLSSSRSPQEAFRLAKLGVAAYIEKPADLDALERAFIDPPAVDLAAQVRTLVGHRSLDSIETEVRTSLVTEAVARASGSKSHAARLLSISRQLLQHILRRAP